MVSQNRKRIGILFNFSGSWLGGVYYIQNIIKALNYLHDDDKPYILIFYKNDLAKFAREIEYPYLECVSWDFISTYKGYLFSWILKKNLFVDGLISQYCLDGIYPLYDQPVPIRNRSVKIVSWFPDLQHKFFPNYFSNVNLFMREMRLKLMMNNSNVLVVSSNDVANHFKKFYKIPDTLNIHVLPFVSIINDFCLSDLEEIKKKYKMPDRYFIVSNQFYEHKNHLIIVRALKILRNQNISCHIVFTGKMEDYRNPKYIKKLKAEIEESNISECVSLLGVIPRVDQLCLLKHAEAVIQPSLFEGWSTVIEDAKSLQVPVICSDIAVHVEQLGLNGIYFSSNNSSDLANILKTFPNKSFFVNYENYTDRVEKFAYNFISIFD